MLNHLNKEIKMLSSHGITYPAPVTLSYFWNFGFIAAIFLIIQIATGIFLAMHYIPSLDLAFLSVEHIMRDVKYGWLMRYAHSNGASMFFIAVYLHIARGLYYRSFSDGNASLWVSGILIFLVMIVTAFIGYVLPWGQMSYWGATVITNLVSALPVIGLSVVHWLWGGFSVGGPTLSRFLIIHYLLPILLLFLVGLHFIYLHRKGGSSPSVILISNINRLNTNLYPYFIVKDFLGLVLFLMIYVYFIAFYPNYLGHSDNYIEANALVTPEHIVPEWYFLPFYAILRSIPDKLGGVIFMLLSILLFFILPYLENSLTLHFYDYSSIFVIGTNSIIYNIFIKIFFSTFILLGWLGCQPIEEPFILLGVIITSMYFIIVLLIPIITFLCRFFFLYDVYSKFIFDYTLLSIGYDVNIILDYFIFDMTSGWESYNLFFNYLVLFIFICACIILSFILLFLSYFCGTFLKDIDSLKLKAYECGFDPIESTRKLTFDIHFFRIALLFLIFDIEIVYLIPWALIAYKVTLFTFCFYYIFVLFFCFLLIGFCYEYLTNVTYWSIFLY